MKKTGIRLFVIILIVSFYYGFGWVLGAFLEPGLERTLTGLFGMPVSMERLHVRPFPGYAKARNLVFFDQEPFEQRPHLIARSIRVRIDYTALFRKVVLIKEVVLKRPIYYIEKQPISEGPRTNVTLWWKHIKAKTRKDEKDKKDNEKKWTVDIRKIELQNAAFIYQDYTGEKNGMKFVFDHMQAELDGFKWPSADPMAMRQKVRIDGTFGEISEAPFWIEGSADFATSRVSFDLNAEVKDGSLLDHPYLWENFPVNVVDGRYDLKIKIRCEMRKLISENEVVIKDMKAKSGLNPKELFGGIPFKAWAGFVESQKTIHLNIPVVGDITDPNFQYNQAFRQAFQQAFNRKIQTGLEQFKDSAAKFTSAAKESAVKLQDVILETPGKLAEGFGRKRDITDENGQMVEEPAAGESTA